MVRLLGPAAGNQSELPRRLLEAARPVVAPCGFLDGFVRMRIEGLRVLCGADGFVMLAAHG